MALIAAAGAADTQLRDRYPDVVQSDRTTYAAALASLRGRYSDVAATSPAPENNRDVWLLTFTGHFYEPFDRANPPPSPLGVPPCREIDIVIDATTGGALLNIFQSSDDCP